MLYFFFSSRRRHTRFDCDWSSDVCSSDLAPALAKNPVAYFSAEFGFHETLPIAAGGLGLLAGHHAKSASDLDLGVVGVSLLFREGYFQHAIDVNNSQTQYSPKLDPNNLPL